MSSAQEEFLRYCRLRNLSPRTIEFYREDISYFIRWAKFRFVHDITKDVVDNFVIHEMDMGNKVTALEHAKRAVEIEPGNEEYRRLLEQLQSGRDFYDSYSTGYGHRVNLSPLWLALCGSQLLCGQTCGCPMIYCF